MNVQHILFLLALLIPLSIDAFVLSTVLGLIGMPKKEQFKTSLILAAFEAVMPAVGVLLGHGLGPLIGHYANYVAAVVIGIAGLIMLWPGEENREEQRIKLLSQSRGWAIINLGISISIDELAIGLSLGLLHISLVFVMVYIGIQAFIASRLGLWLGGKINDRMREGVEKVGGSILVIIAIILIIIRLTGHQL